MRASEKMKKLDKVIARGEVGAKAIRLYSGKLMKNINSSIERGENPFLYIQSTYNAKRGITEIQIVLMGDHHIEDLNYPRSDPTRWKSFGHIVLSRDQAEKMIEITRNVVGIPSKRALKTIKGAGKVLVTFSKICKGRGDEHGQEDR